MQFQFFISLMRGYFILGVIKLLFYMKFITYPRFPHSLCNEIHVVVLHVYYGRRGGLVVSELDSRSRGPDSSPGRVIVLCSWARHFTLTVLLSTQEYKWVPANCQGNQTKCWEVTCNGLASVPPSGRSSNTPSLFMLQKLG